MTNPKMLDVSALLAYCGLIFWLSAQERLPMPAVFDFQDKFLHYAAYFVMGVLAVRALRHFVRSRERITLIAALFCSLYGLSDEWHQSFVPGRDASFSDWLADSIGAVMAVWVMSRFLVSTQKND